MHPVVVPFMNFGVFGSFGVLALFGVFIVWCDNPVKSKWRRFLFGVVTASSFFWFWYGDMNIIRGIMGAVMMWMVYFLLIRVQAASRVFKIKRFAPGSIG
jgi:hypothetical protein